MFPSQSYVTAAVSREIPFNGQLAFWQRKTFGGLFVIIYLQKEHAALTYVLLNDPYRAKFTLHGSF